MTPSTPGPTGTTLATGYAVLTPNDGIWVKDGNGELCIYGTPAEAEAEAARRPRGLVAGIVEVGILRAVNAAAPASAPTEPDHEYEPRVCGCCCVVCGRAEGARAHRRHAPTPGPTAGDAP
jgi:hypothetical protein